jgi:hypothetical protein
VCGACIVTFVALCFSAVPARAQTTIIPTCVVVSFDPSNPVQQNVPGQVLAFRGSARKRWHISVP